MKTEAELIAEAQEATGILKDRLAKVAKINKDAGRNEVSLVTTKRLKELEAWHAQCGLDILKYMPEISVFGGGGGR